jgi:bifunctional DNA-binding transcriptional regulator/antitoxin component of YhaV-PrlF toxin-antitoxin module
LQLRGQVIGKVQITLPKHLAESYGIRVGGEVELVAAGDVIALVPAGAAKSLLTVEVRLQLFDETSRRIRERVPLPARSDPEDGGWTREELYDRGRTR